MHTSPKIVQNLFECPIYETRLWMNMVAKKQEGDSSDEPYDFIQKFRDEFIKLYMGYECQPETIPPPFNDFGAIPFFDKAGQYQYYWCCRMEEHELDSAGNIKVGWFLLAIGNESQIAQAKKHYAPVLEHPDIEKLKQYCPRAYSFYDMYDLPDHWEKNIEKDPNSNLNLSHEETDLLASTIKYPLFITGRAGSGKSTMLQYLFAESLLHAIKSGIESRPLYLSFSRALVNDAKKMAQTLLEKNSKFTSYQRGCNLVYGKHVLPALNDAFCCFEDMVRRCIQAKNDTVLGRRFEKKSRIEFPQFRAMWNDHHGRDTQAKKEYGPELSWHVIRSFIKGWDWEKYLTPDDYGDSTQVGPDEKDVSDETFRRVYDKVWRWYSRIDLDGKWDDLDLIRYCLHPDDGSIPTYIPDKKYAAVFCDEAQDFTRVQTEFILRLSVFTGKRLELKDAEKLPFVFVGDEAQTLNPTGFSWNSLRSYAYTRLCAMLGFERFIQSPEPLTLQQNYRSTLPIVALGNSIQLLRHVRLGNPDFKPQVTHDPDTEVSPVYCLNPADPVVWVYLKRRNATVIIPGGDGQSAKDFLEKTVVSEKGLVEFTDNGIPKPRGWNVISLPSTVSTRSPNCPPNCQDRRCRRGLRPKRTMLPHPRGRQ